MLRALLFILGTVTVLASAGPSSAADANHPIGQALLRDKALAMTISGSGGSYTLIVVFTAEGGSVVGRISGGWSAPGSKVTNLRFHKGGLFRKKGFSFTWRDVVNNRNIDVRVGMKNNSFTTVRVSGPGRRGGYFTEYGSASRVSQ